MDSNLHNTPTAGAQGMGAGRKLGRWGFAAPTAITFLLAGTSLATNASACWAAAAERYGIAPELLYAVASVESNLNAAAVNRSHLRRTGSYDIGLMQINSTHVPMLARYGITEAALYEPCINLQVGAWLLADAFSRHGVTWNAVGAYNASCSQLKGSACTNARARYAWQIYRRLLRAKAPSTPTVAASISQPVTFP